jgi:bla regulator protein blaR1
LWQSTVFACGVWLVTLALTKNRAAVRHRLWVAASLKFLVPFAVLVSLGSQVGSQVGWRSAPVLVETLQRVSEPFAVQARAPAATAPSTRSEVVPGILIGLWLCGFAANIAAWWRRWRSMRTGPAMVLGVCGAFRPLLLLPDGIAERLTPAQFDAVVQHELCHMRRRDNLTAAIHMLVEALFWFHPLVWWIEARLIEERERACDEEVLRLGSDPRDYAEAIVKVARFYLESPLACVAGVTGANLKRRVERIMLNRRAPKLSLGRKLLLAAAGISAVAGPVTIGALNALALSAPLTLLAQRPPLPGAPLAPAGAALDDADAAGPTPMKFQMKDVPPRDAFEADAVPSRQMAGWSG